LFLFSLLPGEAQLSQRPGAEPAASASRSVTLDVVVTDKSGKPVSGLQQQDFAIVDNKQPRKIASFRAVEGGAAPPADPVETIVFFDGVNISLAEVGIEQQQIEAFLKNNAAQLPGPTTIVLMGQLGVKLGPTSSRDANDMVAALNRNRSGQLVTGKQLNVYGLDGWQELSLYTLDQLASYELPRPGRKLLVWISPGWPLLRSDVDPGDPDQGLNPKEQKEMFSTIVGLEQKLRQAHVTVFQIDPSGLADADRFGTSQYKQFEKGVKAANYVEVGSLGLQVLADQSGGLVLNSSNDIAGEIAKCLSDAKAYYTIAFDSPPGDGKNEYHALEVKIGKPGLTARTRMGYYAQP
jgi:VWFA-related protein